MYLHYAREWEVSGIEMTNASCHKGCSTLFYDSILIE